MNIKYDELLQNNSEVAKRLVPSLVENIGEGAALKLLLANNCTEGVKLLLPDLSENLKIDALEYAAINGNTEIIKLLLPLPFSRDAICYAAWAGHEEIVRLLISSASKRKIKIALVQAELNNHTEVATVIRRSI